MSKERFVSFGTKIEGLVRFCSLACQVMVYFLKNNSFTEKEVRNLPINRTLGVSIEALRFSRAIYWLWQASILVSPCSHFWFHLPFPSHTFLNWQWINLNANKLFPIWYLMSNQFTYINISRTVYEGLNVALDVLIKLRVAGWRLYFRPRLMKC